MGISIKDPKAEELAKEVARKTGESVKEAVIRSLEERLQRISRKGSPPKIPRISSKRSWRSPESAAPSRIWILAPLKRS